MPLARALAAVGGTVGWMLQADRRRTLLENLRHTAPDQSDSEHRRMARRTFRNLAVTAVDQFRLPNISIEEVRALFEIRGLEHVDSALARGKGIVVATAHLGPYELAAACLAANGYTVAGMYENLKPELLEALATYRSATGMQLVNMKDLRAAFRVLGEGHILALISDRVIGDTRGVIELPFAGGRRVFPTGPAVLAQATGAALITAFAHRERGGKRRYVMEFDAPLFAESRDAAERDRLMRAVVERISAAVRRNPEQWFVFQPNWISREPV